MLYVEFLINFFSHSLLTVGLCLIILLVVYLLNNPKPNSEKNMAYECGFKPFDFTYYPFDVQFYRVGILFLLFDVEILFFFP
jgi:NADH-quinone oxidoreductase subunit A